MKIEFTEHGIERVMQRALFITRENAIIQIERAWILGEPATYEQFRNQWLGFRYIYFDGMVFVFLDDDSGYPPVHKTVLFPAGQTEWRVRAA